jgi:LuxR family quorum sensing-dependent transcriptional regulator
MTIENATFDFLDRIRTQDDPKVILEELLAQSSALGFPHFMITGLPLPMEELAPLVMLNAWPQEWYGRYTQSNYFAVDGVAQWSLRTTRPYRWDEVPAEYRENRAAKHVMAEANEFGFRDGYVVPMYSPRHWQTAVAFASDQALALSTRDLGALQIMGVFAAESVRRLLTPEHELPPMLSPRERDCLTWAARGKTSWDISVILGIGHQTVRGYFATIRQKLDVTTMAQAVAESIRRGEIRP